MIDMFLQYFIINNILFTSIIIAVFVIFAILKNSYMPTVKYYIWNIICIAILIPPKLYRNILLIKSDFFKTDNTSIAHAITGKISATTENIYFVEQKTTNSFLYIWLSVALIYFLFQIASYFYFRYRIFRISSKVTDIDILSILDRITKQQNIYKSILVRYSYFAKSPMLIGFVNPTIILPYGIEKRYLYYIFKHELFHYKYLDLWLKFIRLIVQSLYWFNPVIWMMCIEADKDMEIACDCHVLTNSSKAQRKEYANAILNVISTSNRTLVSNFNNSKKYIYCRMENIMDNKFKRKGILLLIVVLISILYTNVLNAKLNIFQMADSTYYLNNMYIPLEQTFEDLGYKIIRNDDSIEVKNSNTKIKFIFEENYKLKKDYNTYYAKKWGDDFFVKIAVLKDLGYSIQKDNNCYFNGVQKIKLNTEAFGQYLYKNTVIVDEVSLPDSTEFHSHKILKQNIDLSQLDDYTVENKNLMGYNLEQLEKYIDANENMTLKQYKKNLISIENKYPSYRRATYSLLDNGQLIAYIVDSDNKKYIELAIEIRDGIIYLER